MASIRVTAKRQATLPVEFCRELGIKPGDEISVEKRLVDGERVWTLVPRSQSMDWFGSLRKYGRRKSHDLAAVRKSVAKGLSQGKQV